MSETPSPDPSTSSFYVNPAFYETLLADFSGFDRDAWEVTDLAERDRYRRLLEREARLLDGQRFEDWLALFCPECLYWAPGTPGGGDPRREVAVFLDDRRRMEDRVHRLRSRFAWSQAPASRRKTTTKLKASALSMPVERILMRPDEVARSQAMSPETSVSWIAKLRSAFRVAKTSR